MKQALRVGLMLCMFLGVALPAAAAPSIEIGMTPGLPGFVQNPDGLFSAWCQVHTDGTTPALLQIRLFNELDEEILFQEFPDTDYYYLYWNVPAGMNDGVYHYKVNYIAREGDTAEVIEGFLVAGLTRGLCTFKFIDDDGDGIFDEGVESLAPGWEICITGPLNECQTTDEDGVACWFFIPSGVYHVCETLQPGYVPTTPVCQDVEITDSIGKAIFGNKLAPPTGACCFYDGSCSVMSQPDCELQGGIYQGDGTVCDPNPCPPPTGACCLPTGDCIVTTAEACLAQNGVYQGDNFPCDPSLCPPPVPTQRTTWGQVKNTYR